MRTRSNYFFVNNGILTLSKYSTVHYHNRIKQSVKNINVLCSVKTPSLRGLTKVHKETIPIRALVKIILWPLILR